LKALLKFYHPDELFTRGTHEILFLYICCDKKYIGKEILNGKVTVYFNMLQQKINYGFMDVNTLKIVKVTDEELTISSKMFTDTSSSPDQIPIILKLNFSNIPLRKVGSIAELENYSTDYFENKVRENINFECIF